MEYISKKNIFEKVNKEKLGKSGWRRIVKGKYIEIDNKGRDVMIGEIEKKKLVYIMNRDEEESMNIY